MAEPTSTTTAAYFTLSSIGATVPVIAFMGTPLGLRIDVLIAGFLGSVVGIILLNTVPGTMDTWLNLVRTTGKRMAVAFASSVTAGYLTPLVLLIYNVQQPLLLSIACVVGAGAQRFLSGMINRWAPADGSRPAPEQGDKP